MSGRHASDPRLLCQTAYCLSYSLQCVEMNQFKLLKYN